MCQSIVFLTIFAHRRTMQKRFLKKNMPAKKPIRPKADILPSERQAHYAESQGPLNDALMAAVIRGKNADINRLVRAGADLGTETRQGQTLMHWAAMEGRAKTCKLLIRKCTRAGRSIKELVAAKNEDGWTPLHYAARQGHIEICALLIREYAKAGGDAGEFIAAKSVGDHTALQYAANQGYAQTCALLMGEYAKAGGNIKELAAARDADGYTAMQLAAKWGHAQTMKLLTSIELLAGLMTMGAFGSFMETLNECLAA